ncbi:MAG: phosphatase PAP2 family protein [Aureispira sp.]
MCTYHKNWIYILLLLVVGVLPTVFGQSTFFKEDAPYRLRWSVEVPVLGLALGTGIPYLALDAQTAPLSVAAINNLDRTTINPLDQPATYLWSPTIARISDGLLYTSMAAPVALLADPKIRKDALPIGVLYVETFALTAGITMLTKVLLKRPRPFVYGRAAPWVEKQEKAAQYAFFSGHTSVSAAMCFMTAKIYHDYNRGKKSVPWVWAAAATVPAVTGILRQQAGKHFWTDVIAGYALGAAIGVLVPELHRLGKKRKATPKPIF